MRPLLLMFLLCLPSTCRADLLHLSNHRGDFQLWGDIGIVGRPTIRGAHAVADVRSGTGQVVMDLANGTASYEGLGATATGRAAVRPFSLPNGLLPDKQFRLTMTIDGEHEIYSQANNRVLPFLGASQTAATTAGLSSSDIVSSVIDLTGSWLLEGPTESSSGTFSLAALVPTGSNITNGGYPFGRFFNLARDGSGGVVGSAFGRETYMFADFEYDFADQSIFSTTVDGEQISLALTRATFATNVTAGAAVPEPSSGMMLLFAVCAATRTRTRPCYKSQSCSQLH